MPIVHRKLLSIAFSGKRSHQNLGAMEGPLGALFDAFEEGFPGTDLQLLSGLADGADQIVTTIFLRGERRMPGAVLPFSLLEYITTIHNKAAFQSLYDQCHYRLHLDGRHAGTALENNDQKEAYRQQARILPRLCDVFLATAEKEEEGLKGGTKEAILAALVIGKPVILLNLNDLRFYFYNSMEEWLFSPPTPLTASEIVKKCSVLHQKDILITPEAEPRDLFFRLRKWIWSRYESLFNKKASVADPTATIKELDNTLFYKIEDERKKASESSKYFMFQYRGGYLLNYCLAIAAIFIAVDSSTVHLFKLEQLFAEGQMTERSLLLLGLLKVGVILLIIRNTKKINSHQYNTRAIKFRYTAERLRILSYFSLFGIFRIPKPLAGNHINTHLRDYQGEAMFRRIINEMIIHSRLCTEIGKEYILNTVGFIKEHWLEGQLAYYERDLKKMKKMDEKLVKFPEWLSKIVLAIVLAEILEILLPEAIHHHPVVALVLKWVLPVLIAATILLPGIITTINSMHFQTEAKRLAFRNEIMLHQMKKILADLDAAIEKIGNRDGGSNLLSILVILDEAASLATDEVAEWTMIYEKRVFEPG